MKKTALLALCALLLLASASPAGATVGRDILMAQRRVSSWTGEDMVSVLTADGTILLFDLDGMPWETRNDPEELLYFLRVHGLSKASLLYGAAAPRVLSKAGADFVRDVRALLGQVEEEAFETSFYATDAGAFLTYAVLQSGGEGRLSLLAESGTYQGQTKDPAALALMALAGPVLMGE